MSENSLKSSVLRPLWRFPALLIWYIVMVTPIAILRLLGMRPPARLFRWVHGGCCRILGIRIIVRGTPNPHVPTLFATNHLSYLDIVALGSVIDGSFLAKQEIRHWPVLGWLASLQETLFINRQGRSVHHQLDLMAQRLAQKRNLIFFPEGTTSNGEGVARFKSSLFGAAAAAEIETVWTQPVSLAYSRYAGQAMSQKVRNIYAWYGGAPLFPHIPKLLCMARADIELIFHPPARLADFPSRKEASTYCHELVSRGVMEAYRRAESEGRPGTLASQSSGRVSAQPEHSDRYLETHCAHQAGTAAEAADRN